VLLRRVNNLRRTKRVEDKVYEFLNPAGSTVPVDTSPLAPRLDSLDGKTLYFNICGEGKAMTEL